MITETQYNLIKPHREDIRKFQDSKTMNNHEAMTITDKIRQQHGMGAINYGCTACKVVALNDIWNMIVEYEANLKTEK
jgi:hypothetical protein